MFFLVPIIHRPRDKSSNRERMETVPFSVLPCVRGQNVERFFEAFGCHESRVPLEPLVRLFHNATFVLHIPLLNEVRHGFARKEISRRSRIEDIGVIFHRMPFIHILFGLPMFQVLAQMFWDYVLLTTTTAAAASG